MSARSSLPGFAVALLFCALAAYVITRSPRSRTSQLVVAALLASGAFLLGQGMQANASTIAEWVEWERDLLWGATTAPVLWYWVTVLLLNDAAEPRLQRWTKGAAIPLGGFLVGLGAILTVLIYTSTYLFDWSAAAEVAGRRYHYKAPAGPAYPGLILLYVVTTFGGVANAWQGWRHSTDLDLKRRFATFLPVALLLIVAGNYMLVSDWLDLSWPAWVAHLLLAVALGVIAWSVVDHNLAMESRVIRTDFVYVLATLILLMLVYIAVYLATAPYWDFHMLELLVFILGTAILTHSLMDGGQRVLDRLFFDDEVRHLRADLTKVAQHAAQNPDFDAVLEEARRDLAKASDEHLVRLTEEGLRRLNNPAALAQCGLIGRLPCSLAAAPSDKAGGDGDEATPLIQARALRQVLSGAIERLKPGDDPSLRGSPAALQHSILREEYLQGLPNVQIMTRHSISEATFHRNRRAAIAILAKELGRREELLAQRQADSL